MGGYIAVGVIDESGNLETIVGHTNALPKTFKNSAFIGGDFSQLHEYLEHFRQYSPEEGYGPSANVPSEYGYILFDLKDRAIISAQNYTSVGTLSGPQVTSDAAARILSTRISYDGDERVATVVGPYASVAEFNADPSNDPRGGVPSYADLLDEILTLAPKDLDRSGTGSDIFQQIFDSLPQPKREDLLERLNKSRAVDEYAPTMFTYEIDYGNWLIVDGDRDTEDMTAVLGYISDRVDISDEFPQWDSYLRSMQVEGEEATAPAL